MPQRTSDKYATDLQAAGSTLERESSPTGAQAPAPAAREPRQLPGGVSWPWTAATIVLMCLIWGNSLVPGSTSGAMSTGVLSAVLDWLKGLDLPYAWLTELIVRKAGHCTEYFLLALCTMQALRPHRREKGGATRETAREEGAATCEASNVGHEAGAGSAWSRGRKIRAALVPLYLVAVPTIDELVIQRHLTTGRSGEVRDIIIDCCAATVAVLITLLISHLRRRRK